MHHSLNVICSQAYFSPQKGYTAESSVTVVRALGTHKSQGSFTAQNCRWEHSITQRPSTKPDRAQFQRGFNTTGCTQISPHMGFVGCTQIQYFSHVQTSAVPHTSQWGQSPRGRRPVLPRLGKRIESRTPYNSHSGNFCSKHSFVHAPNAAEKQALELRAEWILYWATQGQAMSPLLGLVLLHCDSGPRPLV